MPFRREWQRTLAHMTWGAAAILAAAALYAAIHYTWVTPIGPQPTFRGVLAWQLATWSLWVPAIPLLVVVAERISLRAVRQSLIVAQHVTVAAAVLTLHALWYAWVTTWTSPYQLIREFDAAFFFYLRWTWPTALMIYAAIAIGAMRAARSLVTFTSTPEGLLRTGGPGARAPDVAMESLLEAMRGAVIVYDQDTLRILAANEAATEQYGLSAGALRGRTVLDLLAEGRDDSAARSRMRRRRNLPIWRASEVHVRADGTRFAVEVTNHAVIFDGRWARMMIVTDIDSAESARRAHAALLESERRTAELQLQLAEAQLRALKLQLKPHFLFNILNTVGMMIRNGEPEKAQEVVSLLGELFRHLLEFEGQDTVSLDQEFAFVDLYLALERFRFEDRMTLSRDVAPDAQDAEVPILILQPLVENAVKHGVAPLARGCAISISARRDGDALRIEIRNDVREGRQPQPGHGIGIANTRARLREMYGDAAHLELFPSPR